MDNKIQKVVLAYSGGLDTSIIVKWLLDKYKCEVIAFAADVGQEEELKDSRKRPLRQALPRSILMIYGKSLREILFFLPLRQMRYTKASI